MSKRTAKKRIVNGIATAIDQLLLSSEDTERQFDEKTEQLFKLYDDAMARINSTWKIKDRATVKQHYKTLYADLQTGINAVIGKK